MFYRPQTKLVAVAIPMPAQRCSQPGERALDEAASETVPRECGFGCSRRRRSLELVAGEAVLMERYACEGVLSWSELQNMFERKWEERTRPVGKPAVEQAAGYMRLANKIRGLCLPRLISGRRSLGGEQIAGYPRRRFSQERGGC